MAQKIIAEIDPEQLAREPIIVEQDGTPVGAVIPIQDYLSFRDWKQDIGSQDDFPPAWYEEKTAFSKMLPELLTTHRDRWVAIYKGSVIDSDEKPGELLWRVERNFGDEPVYVGQVLEKPRVYQVPSAWIKRE